MNYHDWVTFNKSLIIIRRTLLSVKPKRTQNTAESRFLPKIRKERLLQLNLHTLKIIWKATGRYDRGRAVG